MSKPGYRSALERSIVMQAVAGSAERKRSFNHWWRQHRSEFEGLSMRDARKLFNCGFQYGRIFQMDYPKVNEANWKTILRLVG